ERVGGIGMAHGPGGRSADPLSDGQVTHGAAEFDGRDLLPHAPLERAASHAERKGEGAQRPSEVGAELPLCLMQHRCGSRVPGYFRESELSKCVTAAPEPEVADG